MTHEPTTADAKAAEAWRARWKDLHQELDDELAELLRHMRNAEQHLRPPDQRIQTMSIFFEETSTKNMRRLLVAALSRLIEQPPPPTAPTPLWQRIRNATRRNREQ